MPDRTSAVTVLKAGIIDVQTYDKPLFCPSVRRPVRPQESDLRENSIYHQVEVEESKKGIDLLPRENKGR